MNKTLKSLLIVAVGLVLASVARAGSAGTIRAPRPYKSTGFSATAVLACKGPAAVYSVVLSTGAATDFAVLRDSNTANTSSTWLVSIPHVTSAVTQVVFDPPLQFVNGVSLNDAAGEQTSVMCENGYIRTGN